MIFQILNSLPTYLHNQRRPEYKQQPKLLRKLESKLKQKLQLKLKGSGKWREQQHVRPCRK